MNCVNYFVSHLLTLHFINWKKYNIYIYLSKYWYQPLKKKHCLDSNEHMYYIIQDMMHSMANEALTPLFSVHYTKPRPNLVIYSGSLQNPENNSNLH